MSEAKLRCPLRRVTTRHTTDPLFGEAEVNAVFQCCYEARCAWWDGEKECCVIVAKSFSEAAANEAERDG